MASAVTSSDNIIVNRDYTDNFSIKETAMTNLGSKYFAGVDLAALNVGELGFVLEQMANITEDSFNTSSVMMNEAFPNKAIIPESIYSHAAIFQLADAFVSCASCSFVFLLQQSDVLKYGEKSGTQYTIYIDKNTIITVSDENNNLSIPFTLDYDIQITARSKEIGGKTVYDYAAQYVMNAGVNSVSGVNDPYLKIRAVGTEYLILQFTAHQVERTEIVEPIISNSKINYPILTFDFDDDLAGMDIFYRSSSNEKYCEFIQLEKRVKFSLPIQSEFCYYRLKDEHTIEISFNTNDKYFQPDFNSEIKVVMYTTMGKKAEFGSYNGNSIDFQMNSEKYPYNNLLIISAKVVSPCVGATNRMTMDELKALTVESYSSANEISNEHDIMTYFYNYKYRYSNEMIVVKKRDDISERLFSAFILLKNGSYVYPTNTLNLSILEKEFDTSNQEGTRFALNPGHVFVYKNGEESTVEIARDENGKAIMVYDKDAIDKLLSTPNIDFAYTNPFLISVNELPNAVGLYKNVVSHDYPLDYISSRDKVFSHFITSKINISRSLSKDAIYTLSVSLIPSVSLTSDEIDNRYINMERDENGKIIINPDGSEKIAEDGHWVRVIVAFVGSGIDENCYVELKPTFRDANDTVNVTFSANVETDDYIRSDNEFGLKTESNGYDDIIPAYNYDMIDKNVYIPISDTTVNVYILYKTYRIDEEGNNIKDDNIFNKYPSLVDSGIEDFSIVNTYSTKFEKVTFIEPMNMMRSTVTFSRDKSSIGSETGEEIDQTRMKLDLLPMVKADMVNDEETFGLFVDTLTQNYSYIEAALPILKNNTHIDIKFYNTYGKSKNYYIGDESSTQIDRVNITIKFRVVLVSGVDDIDVKARLSDFIKNFVERLNSSGNNSLYISNLIREIETNFAEVHHLKFVGINGYGTDYQTISVQTTNINDLSADELRRYVPEMLVTDVELIMDTEDGI